MSKTAFDFAKSALNYQLYDDDIPVMKVKDVLAIVAVSLCVVGGSAYFAFNVWPDVSDWIQDNIISVGEEQAVKMSSVPTMNLL